MRHVSILFATPLLVVLVQGCSGNKSGSSCSGDTDCKSGSLCGGDNLCHKVCKSAKDCSTCESCQGDLCMPAPNCIAGDGLAGTHCVGSGECGASAPICDGNAGECRGCSNDAECLTLNSAKGVCLANGACVECEASLADCPPDKPICDGNVCRGCGNADECTAADPTLTYCDVTGGGCAPCSPGEFLGCSGDKKRACKANPTHKDFEETVSCNDSIACTTDTCNEVAGGCENTPDDAYCDGIAPVSCTVNHCDPVLNCVFDELDTAAIAACDDTLPCNGLESCSLSGDPLTGCKPGIPPNFSSCSGAAGSDNWCYGGACVGATDTSDQTINGSNLDLEVVDVVYKDWGSAKGFVAAVNSYVIDIDLGSTWVADARVVNTSAPWAALGSGYRGRAHDMDESFVVGEIDGTTPLVLEYGTAGVTPGYWYNFSNGMQLALAAGAGPLHAIATLPVSGTAPTRQHWVAGQSNSGAGYVASCSKNGSNPWSCTRVFSTASRDGRGIAASNDGSNGVAGALLAAASGSTTYLYTQDTSPTANFADTSTSIAQRANGIARRTDDEVILYGDAGMLQQCTRSGTSWTCTPITGFDNQDVINYINHTTTPYGDVLLLGQLDLTNAGWTDILQPVLMALPQGANAASVGSWIVANAPPGTGNKSTGEGQFVTAVGASNDRVILVGYTRVVGTGAGQEDSLWTRIWTP